MQTLYEIGRDQGSLIGGLLALVAGVIAYCGAWNAAKLQVNAVNIQTAELRKQDTELKNDNRRRLAGTEIGAIKLISSVLNRVTEGITRVENFTDEKARALAGAVLTEDWRNIIRKPALATVLNHLSLCGPDVVDKYLLLDAHLDAFAERANIVNFDTQRALEELAKIVEFLNQELSTDAARCYALLEETSAPSSASPHVASTIPQHGVTAPTKGRN